MKRICFLIGVAFLLILVACSKDIADTQNEESGSTNNSSINENNSSTDNAQSDLTNEGSDSSDTNDDDMNNNNSEEDSTEANSDESEEDKASNDPSDTPDQNKQLTESQAVAKVRAKLKNEIGNETIVEVDHTDEDGNYVVHVYDIVENNGSSHTATRGWYTVNPTTEVIESLF